MTQVCLVGSEDVNLRYELLSRETARDALATYDLREPFANTVAVETVSLGSAVALLNDLDWYLVRFADAAFVREPSISDEEWLSRELATAVRDDDIEPAETDRFLRIYGVEPTDDEETEASAESPPALVEPMLVTRTGDSIPEYDLRPVEDTVVVRVTKSEFGA
ncbi:MAG: DUF5804 family protein [Haloarculaceae archaeon]